MRRQKVNIVFLTAAALVAVTALWGLLRPKQLEAAAGILFQGITGGFGWFYPLAMTLFTGFAVWIGFSANISTCGLVLTTPGRSTAIPPGFAMLFSAGMGVGLVFWSVAEPLQFYVEPLARKEGPRRLRSLPLPKRSFTGGSTPGPTTP